MSAVAASQHSLLICVQGEPLTNKYEVTVDSLNITVPIIEHLFDFVHSLCVMKE